MKKSDQYQKWVEWSEEDQTFPARHSVSKHLIYN